MIKSGASTVEIKGRNQCSLWWVMDDCDEALFVTTIAVSNQKFSESSRFNKPQKMGNLLSVKTWAKQWVVLYRLRRPIVHPWLQCGQHPPSSLTGSKVMQLVMVGSAVVTDSRFNRMSWNHVGDTGPCPVFHWCSAVWRSFSIDSSPVMPSLHTDSRQTFTNQAWQCIILI